MPFTQDIATAPAAQTVSDHTMTVVFHRIPQLSKESKLGFQSNSSKAPNDCEASLELFAEALSSGNMEYGVPYMIYCTIFEKAGDVEITDPTLPTKVE